jgi:hypothetical protein
MNNKLLKYSLSNISIVKILFLPFILSCSTVQYNYHPTSLSYHNIRYGIKEQSVVVVLPIIQDQNKSAGSRTILDARMDIMTSTITNKNNNSIKYTAPNGFILGFKYKF